MYKYTYFNQKGDTQKPKNMIEKRSDASRRLTRLSDQLVHFALALSILKTCWAAWWKSVATTGILKPVSNVEVLRARRYMGGITIIRDDPGNIMGATRLLRGGRLN